MARTAFWDLLLETDADLFANTYIAFATLGRAPGEPLSLELAFEGGDRLHARLPDGVWLELPDTMVGKKITSVSFLNT